MTIHAQAFCGQNLTNKALQGEIMIFKSKSKVKNKNKQTQANVAVLIVLLIAMISAANAHSGSIETKISEIIEHKLTVEKQGVGVSVIIIENNND